MVHIVYDMDDLPDNASIAIYGAGKCGLYTKRYLEEYRPDARVNCFVDTYKEGSKDGVPIVKVDTLVKQGIADCVVIASHYWKEISTFLSSKGLDSYLLHPLLNLGVFFTEKEFALKKEAIEEASLVFDDDSRKMYLEIMGKCVLRRSVLEKLVFNDHDCLATLYQIFKNYPKCGFAYEDYVDFRRINVLIEGGVFDGYNSERFIGLTNDNCIIHGFEPFLDAFTSGPHAAWLSGSNRFNIYPYGLWSGLSAMHLYKSGPGSCVVENEEANENTIKIELISIDDFVSLNSINSVDYIKLDIEGAETQALLGAKVSIATHRPQMAVAIYHTKEDMINIPIYLKKEYDFYKFKIGHYSPGVFETILYALPS